MNSVKFITLTNNGYLDYTLNCLKSLEKIGFEGDLHCYVIGEESHDTLQNKGYTSSLLEYDNDEDCNFAKFRKGNWHNITKRKFDIIYKELNENDFVCITDGDIVFLDKSFMEFCFNYIENNDLIIQNDKLSDDNHENLCSGFMFIRSNEKTLNLFHPNNVEKEVKEGWGDQKYINNIKTKLHYKTLPLDLFPNGNYYYRENNRLNPMMIHFNYVIGHEKKNRMKTYNKWYV